jgi:hypothetical protein
MIAGVGAAHAQASQFAGRPYVVCVELASSVDDALKEASAIKESGDLDNSAPRATMRAAQETAVLTSAAATIALMRDNKCPLPDVPISDAVYASAALHCSLSTKDEAAITCDRSKWSYGPRWAGRAKPLTSN